MTKLATSVTLCVKEKNAQSLQRVYSANGANGSNLRFPAHASAIGLSIARSSICPLDVVKASSAASVSSSSRCWQ